MSYSDILHHILRDRLIAVIRLDDPELALEIAETIGTSGIGTIEVTMTTPGALGVIERLADREDFVVGAGTVLTEASARAAFDAGALFFASPVFDPKLVEIAHTCDRLAMPGAYTPTEIYHATYGGADLVKLFPMPSDGTRYIRSLLAPLPDLKLAPSGGVTDITAPELLAAGAVALNVGTWLTHNHDGSLSSIPDIQKRATALVESIRDISSR